jgi:cytochrome c biogenesis factor
MLEKIIKMFFNDWQNLLSIAFIMVSALIVFLGALKPFLFNKIPNKNLRGSALFFSSILLSFVFTAGAFWVKDWNFDYYLWVASLFSLWTIVVYALYEYTRLRALIELIGGFAWNKILGIFRKDNANVKEELNSALTELTAITKKETKAVAVKVKHDNELDNV